MPQQPKHSDLPQNQDQAPATLLAGHWRSQPSFQFAVLAMTCRIPAGKVATYGDLALALDKPGAARAVGHALGLNPFAPQVPCHRVVSASGKLTGYSAPGGIQTKRKLLEQENVRFINDKLQLRDHRVSEETLRG